MEGLKVRLHHAVATAPFLAHPGEDEGKVPARLADRAARFFPVGQRRDVCLLGDPAADITYVQAPLSCILDDLEHPAKHLGLVLAPPVEVSIRLHLLAPRATPWYVFALVWCGVNVCQLQRGRPIDRKVGW